MPEVEAVVGSWRLAASTSGTLSCLKYLIQNVFRRVFATWARVMRTEHRHVRHEILNTEDRGCCSWRRGLECVL